MTTPRNTLQVEAERLALWLDESLRNPRVTEAEFLEKVERYGEVLRLLRQQRTEAPYRVYEA